MLLDPQEAIQCPIRQILGRVGGRWTLDVMIVLMSGSRHFGDLARTIPGISRRMLSITLRGLERDGLVARLSTNIPGDMVNYELTPLGTTLSTHLRVLSTWSQEHRDEILAARDAYDEPAG